MSFWLDLTLSLMLPYAPDVAPSSEPLPPPSRCCLDPGRWWPWWWRPPTLSYTELELWAPETPEARLASDTSSREPPARLRGRVLEPGKRKKRTHVNKQS